MSVLELLTYPVALILTGLAGLGRSAENALRWMSVARLRGISEDLMLGTLLGSLMLAVVLWTVVALALAGGKTYAAERDALGLTERAGAVERVISAGALARWD